MFDNSTKCFMLDKLFFGNKKALPLTSGLAQAGCWLVGHFTGILEVRLPSRPLQNPARPPSRRALSASATVVPSLNTLTLFSTTLTDNGVRKKRRLPKNARQKLQF